MGSTYLLSVFPSLPGSTGDEVKSRTVPQQPPFLSSHSDALQHHGFSPCRTFLRFFPCDHYYVCSRFCFLWGYVNSCQNPSLHCGVLWCRKAQICSFSPSLPVIMLSVAGLTLLSVLSGLALFSILVSFIVNAFYFLIFKIFKYFPLVKVMYCKISFSYFNV